MTTVSTRQPSPETLLSLPIRQRRTMLGPQVTPRFTVVVIKPPELPVHTYRPARGLLQQLLIIPL